MVNAVELDFLRDSPIRGWCIPPRLSIRTHGMGTVTDFDWGVFSYLERRITEGRLGGL